ncbi:MAG TPA: class I SAM-dependent methyltransferase [Haliangium sp.]|nr:class I SAM-dependent methyltransferase [Haliangium sp.]
MDYHEIYAHHAAAYDELVAAEDCDGNLLPALARVMPVTGRVVEVGAGTGRLTRLLARAGATVVATEPAAAMLAVGRQRLGELANVSWHQTPAHALPVADGWADAGIAGWVFGHFREWMPAGWEAELAQALAELGRVVRRGGTLVIIETLGTGQVEPAPPTPGLAEYYAWLEARGFVRAAIRTDYVFDSVDEAARVTGFFFGEAFAARVREQGWTRVPECTGIWSRAT